MWIRMKKTYAGPAGLFARGLLYDLPESVVEQLTEQRGAVRAKLYEPSCAPWEAGVDQDALRRAQARQPYEIAGAKARRLAAESQELIQKAEACLAGSERLSLEAEDAAKEAKRIAEELGIEAGESRSPQSAEDDAEPAGPADQNDGPADAVSDEVDSWPPRAQSFEDREQ